MTAINLKQLALLTITRPAEAAQLVIGNRPGRQVLWIGLALVAVLNGVLLGLSVVIDPVPAEAPPMFRNPMMYLVVVTVLIVVSIYALYWVGRVMGGKGSLEDIMAIVVWLQLLRITVQFGVLIIGLISPGLATMTALAITLIGIWIILHFIRQAHQLGSIGQAVMVGLGAFVLMTLALSILIALFGVQLLGPAFHV